MSTDACARCGAVRYQRVGCTDQLCPPLRCAVPLRAGAGWVKAADELPKGADTVLVVRAPAAASGGVPYIAVAECNFEPKGGRYWVDADGVEREPDEVTHWMPLPELPQ